MDLLTNLLSIETREFEWKLHNFEDNLEANTEFLSDEFYMFLDNNETKWRFSMDIRESLVSLYLQMMDSETDNFTVRCECYIRKLNNEKGNHFYNLRTSNEYKNWHKYGFEDLVCLKYLKNNTLTLGMRVELIKMKDLVISRTDNDYQKMCKDYFVTNALSDFKIVCSDGTEIPAHRIVLAGFSPVLKTTFDIKTDRSKTMNITDIDGETMTEILRFIYTQEVKNIKKLAPKLLYGAKKYELVKLKKLCVDAMIENLSVENSLDYFILADKYSIKILLLRAALFIKANYDLCKKDWSKFCRNHF